MISAFAATAAAVYAGQQISSSEGARYLDSRARERSEVVLILASINRLELETALLKNNEYKRFGDRRLLSIARGAEELARQAIEVHAGQGQLDVVAVNVELVSTNAATEAAVGDDPTLRLQEMLSPSGSASFRGLLDRYKVHLLRRLSYLHWLDLPWFERAVTKAPFANDQLLMPGEMPV